MLTLKGMIERTEVFSDTYPDGRIWHLFKIWIRDTGTGKTYICQLREDDPQYRDFVEATGSEHTQSHNLTYWTVTVTITDTRASSYPKDPSGYIINYQITNIRELNPPKHDDE